MKQYRCSAQINAHIVVEAESLTEAKRIIDGALQNVDYVLIGEGDLDDPNEELVAMPGQISRTEIMVEQ